MSQQKPDSGKPGGGPPPKNRPANRIYTFSFTLPKLLFAVLFSALALTWVFIFGIMLGRGHRPEEQVPRLARMMPSALSRDATLAPPPPAEVLKPEELKYQDTLKGRTVASAPPKPAEQPRPKAVEPPKPQKPEPGAVAKTTAQETLQAWAAVKETPRARPAAARPAIKTADKARGADKAKAESTADRFDYVYQVAAFKDAPPAEAMRAKLQGAGIKARVEKPQGGASAWYRILVSFRGTPEDTHSLRNTLAQQGIARIILHSKKALD